MDEIIIYATPADMDLMKRTPIYRAKMECDALRQAGHVADYTGDGHTSCATATVKIVPISEKPKGEKWDTGKADASLLLDFSSALLEVAKVGTFGNQIKGYARGSWRHVVNGVTRYTAALGRHLLKEGMDEFDNESNLLHMAHTAWNALARLELELVRRRITGAPINAPEKTA